MFKLVLEKAEDQIANIHWITEKAREFQKNIYFCFIDYAKAFNCVDHKKTVENYERDGNTRPPYLPYEKSVCRSRSNSQNWTWNNRLVPNRERSTSKLYIVTTCPTCLLPKSQNIKQTQYCNKLSKGLKNGPHQKNLKKKIF